MMRKKFNQLVPSGVPGTTDIPTNSTATAQSAADRPSPQVWRWWLLLLTSCGLFSGMGVASLMSLLALPPAADCQKLTAISPDMERLFCAQEAARSGKLETLLAGLDMLAGWTPEHPLYNEAQRSMEDWSGAVLNIARQKARETDLQAAVDLANRIPQSSPRYKDAQTVIAEWKQYWNRGEEVYAKAQAALKQQDWGTVQVQIEAMREMSQSYWRTKRANALSQQLISEQRAQQTVQEAIALAQTAQPNQLIEAVTRVSKLDPKTYAYKSLQPQLDQWSNALLVYGFDQWKASSLDQALTAGQTAFLNPASAEEAQNLIRLSKARQLAIQSVTQWQSSPKHTVNLMEAIAAARQIKSTSRFFGTAQYSAKSWQAQLEDIQKLQVAQLTASLGQPEMLKLAIAQAEQITPGRPRRLQAQTLIADWRLEIQRQEDAPLIAQARALAQPGTIAALRAAIAQAGRVAPGRALGPSAQSLMAEWTGKIQTIEDTPLLAEARILGQQGSWMEAIRAAQRIGEGRSLYRAAQREISGWRAEIRRVELARIRAREAAMRAQAAEAAAQLQPDQSTEVDKVGDPLQNDTSDRVTPPVSDFNSSPPRRRRASAPAQAPLSEPTYVNDTYQPVETAPPPAVGERSQQPEAPPPPPEAAQPTSEPAPPPVEALPPIEVPPVDAAPEPQ